MKPLPTMFAAVPPAIGLLLAGMCCFAASDALAKHLTTRMSVPEMVWFRYVFLVATIVPLVWRQPALLRSGQPVFQVGRCLGTLSSALLFITALGKMPLAEATAIAFASPVFVTVLSALLLKEHVGRLRWLIVGVGFVGVLIVMQPGSAAFKPAAVLAVASAMAWAMAVMFTRKVAETDSVTTTMSYTAILGLLTMSVVALPSMQVPPWRDVPAIAAMGVAWCAAQWLVVSAYQRMNASVLAPFAYSQLLFAALLGWLVFGQWPTGHAMAGMGVILACGLAAAWAAQRQMPQAMREPSPEPSPALPPASAPVPLPAQATTLASMPTSAPAQLTPDPSAQVSQVAQVAQASAQQKACT
jgi:drug/metabolite transporter (DMT)-like permease